MSTARLKHYMTIAMMVCVCGWLTACSGGGGASGSVGAGTGTTNGTGSGGGTTTPKDGTLALTMTSTKGGAASTSVNSITAGTSVFLNASLKDAKGNAVSGAVVTFTVPSTLAVLTPSLGTALTDSNGLASVQMDVAGAMVAGAGAATAAASWGSGSTSYTVTSAPLGFAVGSASVSFGTISINPSVISAYGSATISVPVLVNGSPATVPMSVAFTSGCTGTGKSTLSSPVTTVNGVATTTYKDINSCASTDTITASVPGTSASATGSINVSVPVANNITFSSASPNVIGITGTGLSTSSVVKFKVVDANNNGVAGKTVNFTVTPPLAAGSVTLSATNGSSDANGEVSVSLTAGTVPTPVWVVATLADTPALKSQSTALTVTTGLPTQNFFSLSISTHNIEGWNYDGTPTTITIIASDRLGNPVPDNTAINFVTEGGQIQGGTNAQATCATQGGACSLSLRSANFRPTDGRVTILAYALGEKSFIDKNANNTWDPNETFYDLGDPFIDTNENGTWDSGEQSWSYASGTQACGAHVDGVNTVSPYPGNYQDAPSKANTCNGSMSGANIRAYVRRLGVLTFSGSHAFVTQTPYNMNSSCRQTFTFRMADVNNNPMPMGTVLSSDNENVLFIGASSGKPMNATIKVNDAKVPDTNAVGGTWHSFTVDGGHTDCPGLDPQKFPAGTFDLVVTTPKGDVTRVPFTIN